MLERLVMVPGRLARFRAAAAPGRPRFGPPGTRVKLRCGTGLDGRRLRHVKFPGQQKNRRRAPCKQQAMVEAFSVPAKAMPSARQTAHVPGLPFSLAIRRKVSVKCWRAGTKNWPL